MPPRPHASCPVCSEMLWLSRMRTLWWGCPPSCLWLRFLLCLHPLSVPQLPLQSYYVSAVTCTIVRVLPPLFGDVAGCAA